MPEESGSTPYTAYTYNADDTVATMTDARSAVTTYTYGLPTSSEKRKVLTNISYTAPTPGPTPMVIPVPVSFSYDAVGNRTSMIETEATGWTGTTAYTYDALSRLATEKKTFPAGWDMPDAPNTAHEYLITYNYFLNGSVKKVIDPFGFDIDYTVDHVGRMKTVTGDAFGDTSVTQYVDDVGYRAWGAAKQIDFDNDLTLTQTFDNRLRPVTHRLDREGYTEHLLDKTYTYLPDDKLIHSTEGSITRVDSDQFERSYVFDFAGRIRQARTGDEARGQTPDDPIPYRLDYTYDAFGHNTSRLGTIWFGGDTAMLDREEQSWNATTNKNAGWLYDAAGNTTYSSWYNPNTYETHSQTYEFNAARATTSAQQDNLSGSVRDMDGMQRPARIDNKCLIYSTVFGKVLMETNATGAKHKTYVHDLGGSVIAIQQINYFPGQQFAMVRWDHTDPSGASYIQTFNDGSLVSDTSAELDPTERAVKMFSGDSEEEEDQYGDKDACKNENDAIKGSTPENCAEKASKEKRKTIKVDKDGCPEGFGFDPLTQRCQPLPPPLDPQEIPGFITASGEPSGSLRYQTKYTNSNKEIKNAIEDADTILRSNTDCAKFFGKYGLMALAFLDKQLRKDIVDGPGNTLTGIKQTFGEKVSIINGDPVLDNGKRVLPQAYRKSETAIVNRNGPFFKHDSPAWIGDYRPISRESRVLQILHEVAHLVYKNNGLGSDNVIPDDKGSGKEGQSVKNTQAIKDLCKTEIEKLPEKKEK
jgi:hypothetical protein